MSVVNIKVINNRMGDGNTAVSYVDDKNVTKYVVVRDTDITTVGTVGAVQGVDKVTLAKAVMHGDNLGMALEYPDLREQFQSNLNEMGIFTREDALAHPQFVASAIQRSLKMVVANVMSVFRDGDLSAPAALPAAETVTPADAVETTPRRRKKANTASADGADNKS